MKKLAGCALLIVFAQNAWAAPSTITLSVPGMDCPVCPITVKKALNKVPGVSQADINFEKRVAIVKFDDSKTNAEALFRATKNAGYASTIAVSK